jgi:hypothetical protein
MQLYLKNWYDKFLTEVANTKRLRIVSPFIKEQILRKIHEKFDYQNLELITRFKLSDFASNVSSLEGLKFAVEAGATIFGIRDLHSKIYLFDRRAAIVTSANLTTGGLINNHECGIYITDAGVIDELHRYFDSLKGLGGNKLTLTRCEQWQQEINLQMPNTPLPSLPDYGSAQVEINSNVNYYVKFFGTRHDRAPLNMTVKEEVERALCHYACGFSINKRPRQINDGDVIYLARMTENPNNYAIFGKAVAMKYVEGRDKATASEIMERPWKKDWPIYLRIYDPIFIDGEMSDCVFLYDLIKSLDYMSFPSTESRYQSGERDINPYTSLAQRAYIRLTSQAVEWLEPKFQASLSRKGAIGSEFINSLPTSKY